MSQRLRSREAQFFALLFLCTSLGCSVGPRMEPFDVTVRPQITRAAGVPAAVEVNIIAVSDADLDRWRGYPVNRYWAPKDPVRKGANAFVMAFSAANPQVQTLDRGNPIWQQWRDSNAMNLFIIAFLPSIPSPANPAADPRKLELPLDARRWGDVQKIQVSLSNAGLQTNALPHEP